jgi:hypothetical protein
MDYELKNRLAHFCVVISYINADFLSIYTVIILCFCAGAPGDACDSGHAVDQCTVRADHACSPNNNECVQCDGDDNYVRDGICFSGMWQKTLGLFSSLDGRYSEQNHCVMYMYVI